VSTNIQKLKDEIRNAMNSALKAPPPWRPSKNFFGPTEPLVGPRVFEVLLDLKNFDEYLPLDDLGPVPGFITRC
jgi:hypothetical protein